MVTASLISLAFAYLALGSAIRDKMIGMLTIYFLYIMAGANVLFLGSPVLQATVKILQVFASSILVGAESINK